MTRHGSGNKSLYKTIYNACKGITIVLYDTGKTLVHKKVILEKKLYFSPEMR